MQAHSKGRDVLLAFNDDIVAALADAYEQDSDSDAVHLAKAAHIVRQKLFDNPKPFDGSFDKKCQEQSVPEELIALVNMILNGPSIKDQSHESSTPETLAISQLLKYNAVRHRHKKGETIRHCASQETPLPVYIGLMLHAETRKRELVDKLYQHGLCISYDRALHHSTNMGNNVCHRYEIEQVVCPPTMRKNLFTTSAVDNIDHNPSAMTAKGSFHGTGISLFQHPTIDNKGADRDTMDTERTDSKSIAHLPQYYTDVPPIAGSIKGAGVPAGQIVSLK